MSHTVTVSTECRDPAAIRAACERLKLAEPVHGSHRLYSSEVFEGWAVKLPGWSYPVVFEADGQARFDNFNGMWGEQRELDLFTQAYAVEKAKIEARKLGHNVTEQLQADGTIRLTIAA